MGQFSERDGAAEEAWAHGSPGQEWCLLLRLRLRNSVERCRSGRTGTLGKRVYSQGYRGFESLPLRSFDSSVPLRFAQEGLVAQDKQPSCDQREQRGLEPPRRRSPSCEGVKADTIRATA